MGTQWGWWNGAKGRLAGLVACAGTAAVWASAAAAAQPSIESLPLAAAYGHGVHAYFAGDFERAYEDLSQAIEAGTTDPRAYYFRGLAAIRQGRGDEAEADFTEGATRESAGLGAWPVARSLERVQGPDRLRLERHRTRARVTLLQRQRAEELERYSQIEAAQPDVLRKRRPVGPRVEADDEANPFEQGAAPERVPAEPAAEPATPVEPMPEPAEAAPEAEPAEPAAPANDPFGDSAPGTSKAEQVEQLAAEREDVAAQRDQQAEQEAAAGDR
jgi:tetratricopeptide (TPR) repeat protein